MPIVTLLTRCSLYLVQVESLMVIIRGASIAKQQENLRGWKNMKRWPILIGQAAVFVRGMRPIRRTLYEHSRIGHNYKLFCADLSLVVLVLLLEAVCAC